VVAGFASAPYALYHFNRFTAYGLAANLIAVPLTSIWVMPWAVVAYPLFLFGWESFALVPMGWGVDAILAIAKIVAGWDGAVALFPAMPVWGLVAATLGGAWLCLWQTRWRLAGIPVLVLGLASIATARTPDVLISGDAKLIAVRDAGGLLQVSSARAARLTRETWLRRAGQEEAETWPKGGISADGRLMCDPQGCVYRVQDQLIALARDAGALAEDCRRATVVIATIPVRRSCPSAQIVIDRFALWRDGGHALWVDGDSVRVASVRAERGQRPWVIGLPARRERNARSDE
jgi:competence protein ComEC